MNNEEFNIEFFDEKIWAKGDTGETPIVTIDASVDNTVGTPSVDVNKTGDAEHPHFDIDFKHIKGEKGNTGATPNMTLNATVNQTIGEASVEVEQTGTPEHPRFDIAFSGVKGEKGDKGDTGYTPNIEVGASVDNTVGTPNVTVSKTGTPENPRLEFDFKHLKGVKGEKGDTGTTPNISMSATVGQSIGTPSVNVSKSGSAENPSFTLAFNNIKGEKGEKGDKGDQGNDGLDGFASRLTKKITPVATDYIPINEADGTAKCINYATIDRLLNSWDDVNLFKGTVSSSNYAGISLILNDNGEYTINGTPTGDVYFNPIGGAIEIQNGLYYAKTESEASTSTHEVMFMKKNKTTGATSHVANIVSDQYLTISDADEFAYYCYIVVKKDLVCNDLKIMPNLVLIEAADGNKNNKRIVEEIDANMGIVGNLIPEQEVQTIENNGITFSVESDGSFTMNGTATAQITQYFDVGVYVQKGDIIVISAAENFKDSFPIQSNDQVFFTDLNATTGSVNAWRSCTSGLGTRTFEITATSLIRVGVRIQADHTYDNLKVYPSIHIIGKKDVETAYTNKELGDRIEDCGDRIENCRDKLEFLTDLVDCNELITSPNNIMRAQYANQNNATNTPSASSYRVLTINQTQNYASQIAIDVNRNNRMFIRSKVADTWSDWEKLVTATELAAKYPQTVRLGAINTVDLTANTEVSATIPDWNEMIGDKPKYKEFWVSLSYSSHIQQRIPMTYADFSNIVGNPRNRSIWITDLFNSENYDYEVFVKNDDTTKFYALSRGKNGASGKSIVLHGVTY